MIRVLVVDDSAFMRKAISMILERNANIRVVDTARDGEQALDMVQEYQPDVVTMDVEMPRMNGLEALRRIMDEDPRPVLMISSITQEGAPATVEAMEAGAVGFIPKEHSKVSLDITDIEDELSEKIEAAARSDVSAVRRSPSSPADARVSATDVDLVAIGVSTGGPFALKQVLPQLPADFPVPIAIVQHMPPHFTASLSNRLNSKSNLQVREAEEGLPLEPGSAVIARGGYHLTFQAGAQGPVAHISQTPEDTLHCPSVNVMLASAAEHFNGRVLGVIMTGMGKDGLEGARVLKRKGGTLISQDEDTSVVYGMPRAVANANLSDNILPLNQIASALAQAVGCPLPSTP